MPRRFRLPPRRRRLPAGGAAAAVLRSQRRRASPSAHAQVAAGLLRRRTSEAGRRRRPARPRSSPRSRAAATSRAARRHRYRSCCSRSATTCSGRPAPVLRTLLAGALLMLLIACANVAGLQVSRASRHQRALAIRAALGASPLRLAGHVLVDSAVVTALSLTAALAVAWGMLRLLLWLAPGDVPRLGDVALLDVRVLGLRCHRHVRHRRRSARSGRSWSPAASTC